MKGFAKRVMGRSNDSRAFTLIELLVVIAIVVILIAILLPALAEARKVGKKSSCEVNLKQFGVAISTYATDFQDRIASFSWKAGVQYTDWVGPAADSTQACANQAIDILRKRASRDDLTQITGWIPHVLYTHLVLNDYLQQRLPEKMVACSEDRARLLWQANSWWQDFFALTERPPGTGAADRRWPFSASYSMVCAGWSADQARSGINTVEQGADHRTFGVPGPPATYGNRKLGDVTFPSQKVAWYDSHSRHFDKRRQLYYAYPEARQPLSFFDTSVRTAETKTANRGFRPNQPTNPGPTAFAYNPDTAWEPPTRSGNAQDTVLGQYRWTRGGLRGVDFGGTEVNTGQP